MTPRRMYSRRAVSPIPAPAPASNQARFAEMRLEGDVCRVGLAPIRRETFLEARRRLVLGRRGALRAVLGGVAMRLATPFIMNGCPKACWGCGNPFPIREG